MKTKLLTKNALAALALSVICLGANAQGTIWDEIVASPNHTTLETAIGLFPGIQADLDDPAADLTVFAPDDDAFTNYLNATGQTIGNLTTNLPALQAILEYHVLGSTVPSTSVTNGLVTTPLNTINTLKFTDDGTDLFVNQSVIDGADIPVQSGALHSIDELLLPDETVLDVIIDSPNHTTLDAALVEAFLYPALTDYLDTLTVFGPTDAAFVEALDSLNITAPTLLGDPNLVNILTYHVLAGDIQSGDLSNGMLPTPLNNANTIKVTIDGSDVYVNHALVSNADNTADNGVVHIIDDVIFADETVADVAIDSPNHGTLVAAVVEARLLPALTNPFSSLTVFGPTDAAFVEALDSLDLTPAQLLASNDLADILLYHVLGADVPSSALSNGDIASPLNTANTIKVTIDGSNVFVNHAQVSTPDVTADNGVVHVIDDVIFADQTVADVAIGTGNHTVLVDALVEARLLPAVTNPFSSLTVFAPDDAAFTQFLTDQGISANDLLTDPNLSDILLYHVVGSEVPSTALTDGSVTMLNGGDVWVDLSMGVMVNDAEVTTADVPADNGIVHVIDYVLNPASSSVDEANLEMIQVYPNPLTSTLNVNVENAEYTIVNMAGATVLSGSTNGSIDVNALENGTYFINIQNEKATYRARFMKM